ncbi:prolyl-tRNA synthetase associated domain-containing protein [Parvularcula dongshanensis]|uniref:Ala-tRNA(Pro) deacylase n=1 Tax=Parvularcula dongshanensis TaxID=1173995 RepID=A0A840I1P1_9PROT|nr:prolyl-tRNA synthetase associated domain-containing protein [Parvularcula dongshanensis]MBB4658201.1 Ala-tRNA(Pro) deacylase [Parvularcula dongshanensis]
MDREAALYAELGRLGIAHVTHEHEAVFTVAQSAGVKAALPGGHSKTLLVKDKASLFLLVALGTVRVDLKGVGRALGARGRLSFASAETLSNVLGVTPGSVTPFALMNDQDRRVRTVVLDTNLTVHDPVWFHPLRNTASTAVSPEGLRRFCAEHAQEVRDADLAAPA